MSAFEHCVEVIAGPPNDNVLRFAVDNKRVEGWTALGAMVSASSGHVYVLFERPALALDDLAALGLGGRD